MGLTVENYKEILDQITDNELTHDDIIRIITRIEKNKASAKKNKNNSNKTQDSSTTDPSAKSTPMDKLTLFINTQMSKISKKKK